MGRSTQFTKVPMNDGGNLEDDNFAADRLLASYDYELPPEKIAQNPVVPRDSARLLVVRSAERDTAKSREMGHYPYTHHCFRELPQLLQPGDLLIFNNTRVMPARLYGRKPEGAAVEVLLLEEQKRHCWLALVKPGRRLKPGAQIIFERSGTADSFPGRSLPLPSDLKANVLATDVATGGRILQFDLPKDISLVSQLDQFGQVPFPPYITDSQAHPDQYQTVYASQLGAVAAPTAGLHFTTDLLSHLSVRGIEQAFVTLHVGLGTFRPVESDEITQHHMHEEWVEVSSDTVAQIRRTRLRGGRTIAVGTTAVRALESAAREGNLQPYRGKTDLFIYPGYRWQVVDGLVTNFHLPKSSLLMLVSALIGRRRLLDLYRIAVAEGYRFYSFGDAMLILPEARCF